MSLEAPTPDEVRDFIAAGLACEHLAVEGDGRHFFATIVAAEFEGRSRVAHHLDFPDYGHGELLHIGEKMLDAMSYRFGDGARDSFAEYLALRLAQPHFANARSVRNALDRARLRQATRLFADRNRALSADDLCTLMPQDIRASRVFDGLATP